MAANSTMMPMPDISDTSTQQGGIIAAWIIMFSLATITVGLRFYTRVAVIHAMGPEDWIIAVALVSLHQPKICLYGSLADTGA
jgi:hypothetical protein